MVANAGRKKVAASKKRYLEAKSSDGINYLVNLLFKSTLKFFPTRFLGVAGGSFFLPIM